jgi:hypothetical protein
MIHEKIIRNNLSKFDVVKCLNFKYVCKISFKIMCRKMCHPSRPSDVVIVFLVVPVALSTRITLLVVVLPTLIALHHVVGLLLLP